MATLSYQITKKEDLIKMALVSRALKYSKKPITLSSGLKSNVFLDCSKVFCDPLHLKNICELFAEELPSYINYIGGMATGAIPIAAGVALLKPLSFDWFYIKKNNLEFCGSDISFFSSLKFKAVVVEDVITTGKSVLKCIDVLSDLDIETVKVLALVDREMGGLDLIKKAVPDTKAFFTLSEIETK